MNDLENLEKIDWPSPLAWEQPWAKPKVYSTTNIK